MKNKGALASASSGLISRVRSSKGVVSEIAGEEPAASTTINRENGSMTTHPIKPPPAAGEGSMSEELKPCPFCGKHLERSEAFSTRRQSHFMHPVPDDNEEPCMIDQVRVVDYLDDRKDSATHGPKAWNRRAEGAA
jgi:hypothetical protein